MIENTVPKRFILDINSFSKYNMVFIDASHWTYSGLETWRTGVTLAIL